MPSPIPKTRRRALASLGNFLPNFRATWPDSSDCPRTPSSGGSGSMKAAERWKEWITQTQTHTKKAGQFIWSKEVCGPHDWSINLMAPSTQISIPLLLSTFLPVVAAMPPQWKGLINGTVIYLALGVIAMFFVVCISKPNKPWDILPLSFHAPPEKDCVSFFGTNEQKYEIWIVMGMAHACSGTPFYACCVNRCSSSCSVASLIFEIGSTMIIFCFVFFMHFWLFWWKWNCLQVKARPPGPWVCPIHGLALL